MRAASASASGRSSRKLSRGLARRVLFAGGLFLFIWLVLPLALSASEQPTGAPLSFPVPLSAYPQTVDKSLGQILLERIKQEPFNVAGTVIFFLAILHTFLAPRFLKRAHQVEQALDAEAAQHPEKPASLQARGRFKAELLHLFGEVEAIFGIWIIPLVVVISFFKGWSSARDYIGKGLVFTEPVFVVVIMTIAASRPILELAEKLMWVVAAIGKETVAAWWLAILTVGPVLGSFITEPAAMTISALLLARKFYRFKPSSKLAYATLGLLFVNVSVGGTLTHFAAPPVLMVASKWNWGLGHMITHFGWKAVAGIAVANLIYFVAFRREFQLMANCHPPADPTESSTSRDRMPTTITVVHLLALAWTVLNNHYPALFIGGFLFYLAFTRATEHFQEEVRLRSPLLVGFFLAGLVVHGGLQAWWIGPVLGGLSEMPLLYGATFLTSFNDNAAITYLASLVPNFTPELKYAVVAGAVVGGGLTVIANAPNPAGQSILAKFFPDGVSPLYLFLGALMPTVVMGAMFVLLR